MKAVTMQTIKKAILPAAFMTIIKNQIQKKPLSGCRGPLILPIPAIIITMLIILEKPMSTEKAAR